MSLIPLWLIHKSGQNHEENKGGNAGWMFGLFLIGAFVCGDYSFSFAIEQGWHKYAAYTCGTFGAVIGGAVFAALASVALMLGVIALFGLGIAAVIYFFYSIVQIAA